MTCTVLITGRHQFNIYHSFYQYSKTKSYVNTIFFLFSLTSYYGDVCFSLVTHSSFSSFKALFREKHCLLLRLEQDFFPLENWPVAILKHSEFRNVKKEKQSQNRSCKGQGKSDIVCSVYECSVSTKMCTEPPDTFQIASQRRFWLYYLNVDDSPIWDASSY